MKALEVATLPARVLSASLFSRSYEYSRKADDCRDKYRQNVGQH